jgi:hypothetical protein
MSKEYKRLRESSISLFDSLLACTEQFEKIHRLVAFLLLYQSRIKFQHDAIDEHVYFRIQLSQPPQPKSVEPIMSLFRFYIKDSAGDLGVNCCSGVSSKGNIIQYKIQLSNSQKNYASHPFLRYLAYEAEKTFSKLPRKSAAITADLPFLH